MFFRLLLRRPRPALAALYWHFTRRKVRAQNRLRLGMADLPFAYRVWMATIERNSELAHKYQAIAGQWAWRPHFSVLLHAGPNATQEQVERSIKSVERQVYPLWTVVDGSSQAIGLSVGGAQGDYFVPLRAGDELAESALFRFAESLQADPRACILYGDQDELNGRGERVHPWFKPRWNAEMFLAHDVLSAAVAIRSELARSVVDPADDLDALLLAATSAAEGAIVHIPHVLSHVDRQAADERAGSRLRAVAKHLQPLGASCTAGPFGTVKVQWPLPSELPLVSIVIPTRDKVELLRACMDSVLTRTSYARYEILVVDNGSVKSATLTYLDQMTIHPAIRVLRYDQPYNYSAINNFAARSATGSFLCLLNNDTEAVESDWLDEMMRYAIRPDVGAVGAKLLYGDGSIQHAGVVIGIGDAAGHAHRFSPADQAGYFKQPHVAQFVSAVTAACLLSKRKFEAVGGLDERNTRRRLQRRGLLPEAASSRVAQRLRSPRRPVAP